MSSYSSRILRDKVAEQLTEQPRTITSIGASTGYDYQQILHALRRLRNEGRASPVLGGWIRGGEARGAES